MKLVVFLFLVAVPLSAQSPKKIAKRVPLPTGSIEGTIFLRLNSGAVVKGAAERVELWQPLREEYVNECKVYVAGMAELERRDSMAMEAAKGTPGRFALTDSIYKNRSALAAGFEAHRRSSIAVASTIADVDGRYRFDGLASGTYFVHSTFTWSGGTTHWNEIVSLKGGEKTTKDLNNANSTSLDLTSAFLSCSR